MKLNFVHHSTALSSASGQYQWEVCCVIVNLKAVQTSFPVVETPEKCSIIQRKFYCRLSITVILRGSRKVTVIDKEVCSMNVMNNSSDEQVECPLCMEPLEVDDLNFYPCTCGYQVRCNFECNWMPKFLVISSFRFAGSVGIESVRTKMNCVRHVGRPILKIRQILRLYLKSR